MTHPRTFTTVETFKAPDYDRNIVDGIRQSRIAAGAVSCDVVSLPDDTGWKMTTVWRALE
jgi:hypothetical protein